MQTTKLISTISYNTELFLAGTLSRLVKAGTIEYAHWIHHRAEKDELKAHYHVVLKPNRRLDTSALRNEFREPVPLDNPLGVLPFQSSKMIDWILYAVHDPLYLLKKGQERVERYTKEDIQTTEPDLLNEDWRAAHEGEDNRVRQVIELAKQGQPWTYLLQSGLIPIQQIYQFKEIFMQFYHEPLTERAGREGHEEVEV